MALCDEVKVLVTTLDGGGVADLTEYSDWNFERRINDRSIASARVDDRCAQVNLIDPVCHELRFVQGGRTMWLGPITTVEATDEGFDISAVDRSFNLDKVAWLIRQEFVGLAPQVVNQLLDYAEEVRDTRLALREVNRSTLTLNALGTPGTYVASSLFDLTSTALWFTVIGSQLYVGDQQNLISTGNTYQSSDFIGGLDVTIDGTYMADQVVILYNEGQSVAVYPPEGGAVSSDACGGLLQVAVSASEIVTSTEALQVARSAQEALSMPQVSFDGAELSLEAFSDSDLIPGYLSTLSHESSGITKTLQLTAVDFEGVGQYMTSVDVEYNAPTKQYVLITGS